MNDISMKNLFISRFDKIKNDYFYNKKSIPQIIHELFALIGMLERTHESIIDRPIDDLNMTNTATNSLKRANIFLIKDLLQYGSSDLLKLPGLGTGSLFEIKNTLAEYELTLNGDLS
jgi:DNA-directed RNA polymerase alpha subunit